MSKGGAHKLPEVLTFFRTAVLKIVADSEPVSVTEVRERIPIKLQKSCEYSEETVSRELEALARDHYLVREISNGVCRYSLSNNKGRDYVATVA